MPQGKDFKIRGALRDAQFDPRSNRVAVYLRDDKGNVADKPTLLKTVDAREQIEKYGAEIEPAKGATQVSMSGSGGSSRRRRSASEGE